MSNSNLPDLLAIERSSSSSSPHSHLSRFEMDHGKLYMLRTLMGGNFIRTMNADDLNEFYYSLTQRQWLGITIYYSLACVVDRVTDIRKNLLEFLDADMSVDNTQNLN